MPDRGRRIPPLGQPLVSTIPRAAELFELDADQLAQAVEAAQLEPWPGRHADGSLVYPWDALVTVARQLGAEVPYPPRGAQAMAVKRDRGRRHRHRPGDERGRRDRVRDHGMGRQPRGCRPPGQAQ
jgi:hypothetical protein